MTNIRYDYPMKRGYKLEIPLVVNLGEPTEVGVITVKYKQATVMETIEFLQETEDSENFSDWFFGFLREFGDMTSAKEKVLRLGGDDIKKAFKSVLETRFRGVFESNNSKSRSDGRGTIYSSVLVTVCEKLSIDPDTFQNRYTIEQLNWFIKGISFSINEGSEEGRKENERMMFNQNHNDDDLIRKLMSVKKSI